MIWWVVMVVAAVAFVFLLVRGEEPPLELEYLQEELAQVYREHERDTAFGVAQQIAEMTEREYEELSEATDNVPANIIAASQLANSLLALASFQAERGELEAAEKTYLKAIEVLERSTPSNIKSILSPNNGPFGQIDLPVHFDLVPALRDLGHFYQCLDRHEHAHQRFSQALAASEKLHGEGHVSGVPILLDLGGSLSMLSRAEEAEVSYLRALDLAQKHRKQLKETEGGQLPSLTFMRQGMDGEIHESFTAEERAEEALFLHVACLHNLGQFYTDERRYDEALDMLERAVRLSERGFDLDEPFLAAALHGLADVYGKKERFEEAERTYLRAFEIRERAHEHPDHQLRSLTLYALGKLYVRWERVEEAREILTQAWDKASVDQLEDALIQPIHQCLESLPRS